MISLSGHQLIGSNLTRFVYLDETGINRGGDNPDPYTIVAGVFVHADNHIEAIEQGLNDIILDKIPESVRMLEFSLKPEGFIFQAKQYIHGDGPFKSLKKDDKWSYEDGIGIASAIVDLIERIGLKVVWAQCKNDLEPNASHLSALFGVLIRVDNVMLSDHPDEICIVVCENQNEHRSLIKEVSWKLKNPMTVLANDIDGSVFPLRKIKDTVHFVEKPECRSIQVADTVCYIVKRALGGDMRYKDLTDRLNNLMLS